MRGPPKNPVLGQLQVKLMVALTGANRFLVEPDALGQTVLDSGPARGRCGWRWCRPWTSARRPSTAGGA